jgi:hypothetical protein
MSWMRTQKYFFLLVLLWIPVASSFASELVRYKLPENQWRLISLPADPLGANTVKAVFGDDISGVYGSSWVLYSYNSKANSYSELSYETPLLQGVGYWIIQKTGQTVTLNMPGNSIATKAPFQVALTPPTDKSPRWNLSGNPFSDSKSLSDVSVKTNSGVCSNQSCDLDKADSEVILHKTVWRYTGSRYETVSGDGVLAPWDGFWAAVLEGGKDAGKVSLLFSSPKSIWKPTPGTRWQWQLSGSIDVSHNVDMYDVDLFETPQSVIDQLHADGKVVICYFSAGSYEPYREDAEQFSPAVLGKVLDGYPDEKWLDIRQVESLKPIMIGRMNLAKAKKCDGVEPDNVDAYTNDSGFPLTAQEQLSYNIMLADEAHRQGLSVGLKNDIDQVNELVSHFDWAINEQCFQYNECNAYDAFIAANKAVFGVEYIDEAGSGSPESFCPAANQKHLSWLQKRLALGAWRLDCQTDF